ncbi:MAG: type II secretion system minor pseudopilin GspK, partial [Salinisphaeraceae bacterium]|nr:type II secretion system minor pseudopilin GspK [Salinisphaeraceae bacterium]
ARDWVDTDIEPRFPEGAEDDYYLGLTPAYRTANRPFTSVSELLLVRGVTREIYQKIAPFLSSLPPDTPININTAPPEVLASLSPEVSLEEVGPLVTKREKTAYEDPQDFLAEEVFAGREINGSEVSTSTSHFLLQAQAIVGTTRITLYSLLFRDQQGRTKALIRSKDLI